MTSLGRLLTCATLLGLILFGHDGATAQTYTQIEQRWANGERRELIVPLRNVIPTLSGMRKARARFMLSFALCMGNIKAERNEGYQVAHSIQTTPRPPWTVEAAARVTKVKNWCLRPITPTGGTSQLVVITDEWELMPAQDKIRALQNIAAFHNTVFSTQLSVDAQDISFRSATSRQGRPLECEEQVRVVAETGGEPGSEPETSGLLCVRGLWTMASEVIFWPDEVEMVTGWEVESLAMLPSEELD